MADVTQRVGSLGLDQQWIETSTGKHARLVSSALIGQTTGADEVLIGGTTGGAAYVQAQASTAVIGHLILDGGTLSAGTTSISTAIGQLSTTACFGALIQNDPDNTMDIFVGTTGAQTIQLVPGQALSLAISNVGQVWARASSGTATVNWHSVA